MTTPSTIDGRHRRLGEAPRSWWCLEQSIHDCARARHAGTAGSGARDNEPAYFEQAAREDYAPDDVAFALWGLNETLHALLLRYEQTYGQDLTREDFRSVVEQQTDVRAGIFPPVSYSPQDHFGASTVHVLRADCQTGQYVTEATFASGF